MGVPEILIAFLFIIRIKFRVMFIASSFTGLMKVFGVFLKQVNEFKALAPAIQGNLPQDLISFNKNSF